MRQVISARANIKYNFSRVVGPDSVHAKYVLSSQKRALPPLVLVPIWVLRNRRKKTIVDVQLQEGKVAIAVIGLVLALLGDIFLEGRGDLGVVSVEAVEDGLDVFRPVGRVVEGNHGCDVREERPLNKPSSDFVVKSQSPHFSDVEPWHF